MTEFKITLKAVEMSLLTGISSIHRPVVYCLVLIGMCILEATLCETVDVHPLSCSEYSKSVNLSGNHSRYLNDALQSLSSDTVLCLDEGEHCIFNYTLIHDLANVKFMGDSGSPNSTRIRCTHGNGLTFFNISNLVIEGVTISHCGFDNKTFDDFAGIIRKSIEFFFQISDSLDNYIAVACANCANFELKSAEIANTSGLGFLGINLVGNSVFQNVSFSNNVPSGCHLSQVNDVLQTETTGGGALIIYHDYVTRDANKDNCNLHIQDSVFYNNSYCSIQGIYELHIYSHSSDHFSHSNFMLGGGGGLSIILSQIHYHVNAVIENSRFIKNRAGYGGGALVEIFTAVFDSHVIFRTCNFSENGIETDLVLSSSAEHVMAGSGMGLISDILQPSFNRSLDIDPDLDLLPCTVSITNSTFIDNHAFSGGAIFIISVYAPLLGGTLQEEVRIESCHFERNFGVLGGAIYAHEWKQSPFQRGLDIVFHNVTFDGNIVYSLGEVSSATQNSAIIEILNLNVTFSGESLITNSEGTGLTSASSLITLKDNITFSNNQGSYGGAMRLEADTVLLISDDTNVTFRNNTGAIFGGAIYVSYTSVSSYSSRVECSIYFGPLNLLCFSTVHVGCKDITEYNINVMFEQNISPLGSILYGSTLETCPWAKQFRNTYASNSSLTLFQIFDQSRDFSSPFIFDEHPDNSAQVSTGTGSIVLNETEITARPGETVTIGIQTLDKFNHSVPTVLTTLPSPFAKSRNVSTLLGRSNYYLSQQDVDANHHSVAANLTIFGNTHIDSVNVSLYSLSSLTQAQIAVTITNCSDGFTYSENSHSCECSDQIEDSRIECNEDDFTLTVPQDLWVGPGPGRELVIASCHFDYCLDGKRRIQPPKFDDQCQMEYNRTGIVCGQCLEGYSVIFGSNRCAQCSNSFLAMIIVFALLGIVLVSAISFLHITIAEGYLNGMLFYANVLHLYLPVLTKSSLGLTHIFILVSFLNLNLGFELCFYNGMTALVRTGLALVFPFYIFFLMFIIVIVAKRSTKFSSWFTPYRFSAAKVFATLIVMSYSSILQTCVEILGFDIIESPDGIYYQWRIDNNQGYFREGHIILGLVAIFLLFILLPLPFLLLLEGKLFKFRVFHRYKPLYDAVWAPFKPKFRFWVGLRLILRGPPFIFIYFIDPPNNILLLSMFLVCLLWTQGIVKPFRGSARNALDTFFLSNLLILTLGALYFYVFWVQFAITNTSTSRAHFHDDRVLFYSFVVGVAYIGFCLIITWHLALRFPQIMKLINFALRRFKRTSLSKSQTKLSMFAEGGKKGTRSTYGAVADNGAAPSSEQEQSSDEENYDTGDVVHERKAVVAYTQWREPLLDSGSLEIDIIENGNKT